MINFEQILYQCYLKKQLSYKFWLVLRTIYVDNFGGYSYAKKLKNFEKDLLHYVILCEKLFLEKLKGKK